MFTSRNITCPPDPTRTETKQAGRNACGTTSIKPRKRRRLSAVRLTLKRCPPGPKGNENNRRMPVELQIVNLLVAGSSPAVASRGVAQLVEQVFHFPLSPGTKLRANARRITGRRARKGAGGSPGVLVQIQPGAIRWRKHILRNLSPDNERKECPGECRRNYIAAPFRGKPSGFNSPPCRRPDGKRICPFRCGAGPRVVSSPLSPGF